MELNTVLSSFLAWLVPAMAKLAIGGFLLLLGWRLIHRLIILLSKFLRKRQLDETLVVFLDAIIATTLRFLLILLVMGIVGLDTASLAALFASAGLAVGLAMQGSLSNFAGGVIILFLRPFKVGDFIQSDDFRGSVEAIKIFYTQLVTVDNKVIYIPNGSLANGTIINYTAKPSRRLDLTFGISYSTDIAKAKRIIHELLARHPEVLLDPAPFVGVSEHAASSVTLIVWVWCPSELYWPLQYEIIEQVKLAFDAAHIEIPFPQLDVYIKS